MSFGLWKFINQCISVGQLGSSPVDCAINETNSALLKGHYTAEITKFWLLYFDVLSPNATKYTTSLDKKYSMDQNRSSSLEIKCRIARTEVYYSS